VWFSIHGRNKLSVVLDLKRDATTALKLAARADVLVENFRPGYLERIGLGPAELQAKNPRLVIARVSGYGQDGPYRDRPSFGAIGEAMGGLRHLTGYSAGCDRFAAAALRRLAVRRPRRACTPRSACWRRFISAMSPAPGPGRIHRRQSRGQAAQPDGGDLPEYVMDRPPSASRRGILTRHPPNTIPARDGNFCALPAIPIPFSAASPARSDRPDLADDSGFVDNPPAAPTRRR